MTLTLAPSGVELCFSHFSKDLIRPVSGGQLITDYRLQITDYRVQITDEREDPPPTPPKGGEWLQQPIR